MSQIKERLIATSHQKVLNFLLKHPSSFYMGKEVVSVTRVGKSAVNNALKELAKDGLVLQKKKGRMLFYSVNLDDSLIRSLKITENILLLKPIIKQIKKVSQKIILFGSFASGTNIEDSDIDLFILSGRPNNVRKIIRESFLAEKIQSIIKKPVDFIDFNKKNPLFYQEIGRGFILWEAK